MPSIKDLKKRIGTVKNTQQTTRAMKMVSAAKLRRAQEAILNHRPYAKMTLEIMRDLTSRVNITEAEYPLLCQRENLSEGKRVLLIVVTSDRGLCGGFNSNVIKSTQKWLNKHSQEYAKVELGFFGRRGHDFFKARKVNMGPYFQELSGKVTFSNSRKLADTLIQRFLNNEVDEVKFIYNEFQNAVSQRVVVEDFLPFVLDKSDNAQKAQAPQDAVNLDFIVRPSAPEVLRELLAKSFAIQAFRILLDSQAGEHGARMSAMENATKNAGEMIRKLTLQYNKQRQAGITKELLEIISGSESQKGQ